MDIQATLASNMRFFRKRAGLTQEKLAELCGLHRTYIGGIEQERINVSLNNITKIATALKVKPADLLSEHHDEDDALHKAILDHGIVGDYALCEFDGDDVKVKPLDMQDPDLGVQILVSLIQDGITDETELAERYKETERALLNYFKQDRSEP